VFITGTFYGIRPVSHIENCILPHAPGPMTLKLMHSFKNILSDPRLPIHSEWFHTISEKAAQKNTTADLSNVSIRVASAQDANFVEAALNEFMQEVRDAQQLLKISTVENIQAILKADQFKIFIAVADNVEKIGFVTVSIQNSLHCGEYGIIQELWVNKTFRSKKIGEALINYAEAYCKKQNIKRIDVGLPNYTFSGFEKTSRFYQQNDYQLIGSRVKKVLS
jgi:GNAT superfamily N-acetyltransferase